MISNIARLGGIFVVYFTSGTLGEDNMGTVSNVPEAVENELKVRLQKKYKNIEDKESHERSISFALSKEPNVIYEATVRYFIGKWDGTALFQYIRTRDNQLGYIQQWILKWDWND